MKIWIDGQLPPVMPQKFGPKVMDLDDAETTTRTADGTLARSRIAVKRQFEVVWPAMKWEDISTIMKMIRDPFVEITYPDPEAGEYITKTFYSGDRETGVAFERGGTLWWTGLTVTLTEQ